MKFDRDNISEMIIGDEILKFIDVVRDKIPNSFYKNIESIRIFKNNFNKYNFRYGDQLRACYNPEVNIMLLEDLKSKIIIFAAIIIIFQIILVSIIEFDIGIAALVF